MNILETLYGDLIELWKGIEEIYFLSDCDLAKFTLRTSLLFMTHDLPT